MYHLTQTDKDFMATVSRTNFYFNNPIDETRHAAISIAKVDIILAQLSWEERRALELDDIDNAANYYEEAWELYTDTQGDRACFKHYEPDMTHDEWLLSYASWNKQIPRKCI